MALLNKKTNIHSAEESKFVLIFLWGIPFKAEIEVFEFPYMSFKFNHAEREIIWRFFVIVISDARGFHLGWATKTLPSLRIFLPLKFSRKFTAEIFFFIFLTGK